MKGNSGLTQIIKDKIVNKNFKLFTKIADSWKLEGEGLLLDSSLNELSFIESADDKCLNLLFSLSKNLKTAAKFFCKQMLKLYQNKFIDVKF